jgi:hypothetical protein
MARGTNLFFNNFVSSDEQNLINDLVYESIKIYGIDVGYMAYTEDDTDDILNESRKKYYSKYSQCEMYIRNVDGFEGEGDFLGKFGLEIRDRITFSVARRAFGETIEADQGLTRPREGDLVYLPLNKKVYSVKFVEHEPTFYQMGSLQFYDIVCELFEYSSERLNTGFAEVDAIETSFSTDIYVDVQLTEEDGITALFTEDNIRILSEDEDRSDASTTATKDFDTVTDSDNIQIETDADAILDFSDGDPFSEGGTF